MKHKSNRLQETRQRLWFHTIPTRRSKGLPPLNYRRPPKDGPYDNSWGCNPPNPAAVMEQIIVAGLLGVFLTFCLIKLIWG